MNPVFYQVIVLDDSSEGGSTHVHVHLYVIGKCASLSTLPKKVDARNRSKYV